MNPLETALSFANDGVPVFPCNPENKKPLTANGFKDATIDKDKISAWWTKHPNAMIGVPTGAKSRVWVLDIDLKPGADGAASLAALESVHGKLPVTKIVRTPSGGLHIYFNHVDGIGTRVNVEPAIDVRGEGGYVIAPGSIRSDGCFYELESDAKVTNAPEWLVKRVARPLLTLKRNVASSNSAYSSAAIVNELQKLVNTPSGRNNQLNVSSFAVGQFVGAGEISEGEAEQRLLGAAMANGYVGKDGQRDARATIRSGLEAGKRQPREIPPPTFSVIHETEQPKPRAANDNNRRKTIDGDTLLAKRFEKLHYVVPHYIVEGLTIVAGRPKLGKSWLVYDIAVAVATGGLAMGSIECEQGDVLYLALEDNERRAQGRLLTVAPPGASLRRLTMQFSAPQIDNGLLAEIDDWRLKSEKPRLVIVDVLAKVKPDQKRTQSVYGADYEAVSPLQQYASEHRLAFIVVTHTRKAEAEDDLETVSGTNGLTGAADSILVLKRGTGGSTLSGRGRDIEEVETALQFEGGLWRILGNAGDVARSNERNRIISAIKEGGKLKPSEIADKIGADAVNVRQLLGKMVTDGQVTKITNGVYSLPPEPIAQAA
ncbi:hypothetical protein ABIC03_003556 [Bradyrhizobium sp. RT6a]|uniref:bifunctional DNA primase/polymerase n=1 Tax=unclassified Bradyrhizobium TaxID=2631580 RepID=UPI00339AA52B